MKTLADRLHAAHEQVSRIVRDQAALRKRVVDLEQQVQDSQRLSEVLKARVAELEREIEVLRKAKPAESGLEAPGTKEKIDELVNEIDRCLALISA
jgi:chromosome segregation ATPase